MSHRSPGLRPRPIDGEAPCAVGCPNGGQARLWIAFIAQQVRLGMDRDMALRRAWRVLADRNPLPATLGRICPHPCEGVCARARDDGAVSIHAIERFLGDWALERRLALPPRAPAHLSGDFGIVGAGPAGLSCAFQLARRGHTVTLYDRHHAPGGMLRHVLPEYRLPEAVVEAEARRILRMGVAFRGGTAVGSTVAVDELRQRHDGLLIAIGTQQPRPLELPGSTSELMKSGLEFLRSVKARARPRLAPSVVVVGGGNTAVDAARTARRMGSQVVLVYRRGRSQMPALDAELSAMLEEGARLVTWAAPLQLETCEGRLVAVILQKMRAGSPDRDGRLRPVPLTGETLRLEAGTLITAVAQTPDWQGLAAVCPSMAPTPVESALSRLWYAGDVVAPRTASHAVAEGRRAALAMHAAVVGMHPAPEPGHDPRPAPSRPRLRRPPERVPTLTAAAALAEPAREVVPTLTESQVVEESRRCLSCGLCRGCDRCWMFCTAGGIVPHPIPRPGHYYGIDLQACRSCGKCVEVCPTGQLGYEDGDEAGTPSPTAECTISTR